MPNNTHDVWGCFCYLLKIELFEVDFQLDEVVFVRYFVPHVEADFCLNRLQYTVLKHSQSQQTFPTRFVGTDCMTLLVRGSFKPPRLAE